MKRLVHLPRPSTAAMPIRLVWFAALVACASDGGSPPQTVGSGAPAARIVCDGYTTLVRTPVVKTTPEGVVFEVEVRKGTNLAFIVREAGRGANAEEGRFVWVVPPGIAHVRCLAGGDAGDMSADQTLRIVDPDGIYKSPELGCADAQGVGMSDGPVGRGVPEEQAINLVQGLRPDDIVERAAYPGSRDEATVRVVRDGAVVAALEFENLGKGWIYLGFSSCSDAGLSV
jgi:hypothetical protein